MRRGPKKIAMVELQEMCIEVVHFGKDIGLEQNGGYLQVKDKIDGRHLFFIKIYHIKYNPDKEDDAQDMFITEMGVRDGVLRVKEEMGRVYAVDIQNRTVEMIYTPYANERRTIKMRKANMGGN